MLAGLDISSIESIEIIKDPLQLAKLGPLAANGAIWITTKDGYYGGENVSIGVSARNGLCSVFSSYDEWIIRKSIPSTFL